MQDPAGSGSLADPRLHKPPSLEPRAAVGDRRPAPPRGVAAPERAGGPPLPRRNTSRAAAP
eukprot:7438508-Pyramimonas_sp.AAC.1